VPGAREVTRALCQSVKRSAARATSAAKPASERVPDKFTSARNTRKQFVGHRWAAVRREHERAEDNRPAIASIVAAQ